MVCAYVKWVVYTSSSSSVAGTRLCRLLDEVKLPIVWGERVVGGVWSGIKKRKSKADLSNTDEKEEKKDRKGSW